MRIFLISLIGWVLSGWAVIAEADTGQITSACISLDRPNIDCACVAKRLEVFERVSPSAAARDVIVQGYLFGAGQPNTYKASFEALMADQMAAIIAAEAYDAVGGQPSNITDYEDGCVIADAPAIEIKAISDTEAINGYVTACTASTGDQRFCQCDANRKSRHVSEAEFEAYFRSFSDYDDRDAISSEEMSRARGRAMGLSAEDFNALQSSARKKMAPSSDADLNYCSALTWADDKVGSTFEERENAGFEPELAATLAARTPETKPDLTASRPADTAHGIVKRSCSEQGNSATYCSCYSAAFETDVVQTVETPETALAWALLNSAGAGVSSAEFMSLSQSIPQSSHQAAGMMLMQTMDLGSHCTQGETIQASGLSGSPSARMLEICVKQNEDEALCGCAVEKMQGQFPPDDFELIVDIQEAEYFGAEDPLAEVATQRGLSRAEAEEALANNPAIIGGMMTMGASMMQCMGSMPAMPNLPMMPQQ